MRNEMQT